MTNTKLDKFKALVSEENSGWLEKAQWREANQDWLDISFAIAVKIMSTLRANKKAGTFPKSQKELATALDCSPQYVNKLLKGAEKLNIETISKIQKALKFSIIKNSFKTSKTAIVAQTEITVPVPIMAAPKKYRKLEKVIHLRSYSDKSNFPLRDEKIYQYA